MQTEEKCDLKKQKIMSLVKDILPLVSDNIRSVFSKINLENLGTIEEIRLRANKPVILHGRSGEWFIEDNGSLTKQFNNPLIISQNEIMKTLEMMSENSIYAYQDEIRNGYITLRGGHRVGIAGKVVLDGGNIKNIKDISGLNIRVSGEIPGCSSKIIKYIIKNEKEVYNTLIISPPQCGKTTILRDIARVLSDGDSRYGFKGIKVGVVDERSEIAACYKGIAQNRIGIRTDVLDGCPKAVGMAVMLRALSPQVIITDEIGNKGDKEAVMQVINAGVKIITTAHGYSITELKARMEVLDLMEDRVFERYIVLNNSDGPGTVIEITDGLNREIRE